MALDVHVAASEKKAELKRREMAIDERLHALLFTTYGAFVSSKRYLPRLADYYKDVAFVGAEVSAISKELEILRSEVREESLQTLLKELKGVCDRATAREENIYLFGD